MKWLKVGAVVFSAVLITALGIDAADTLSGSRSTLLGQVISGSPAGTCPQGMIEVPMAASFTCVDAYEASASEECPIKNPSNESHTQENMNRASCEAVSKPGADAWRFISREQAVTACMRAGKRLPNSSEWHLVSVGTPDDENTCNVNSPSARITGTGAYCVSAIGAYDTVGNVWEWTADDVIAGVLEGRTLPASGYVAQVDKSGVATVTGNEASELFSEDYFWSSQEGAYGMLRGGFYGSRNDAGVFAVHTNTLPTTAGTAIGFRCVQ